MNGAFFEGLCGPSTSVGGTFFGGRRRKLLPLFPSQAIMIFFSLSLSLLSLPVTKWMNVFLFSFFLSVHGNHDFG